MNLLPLERKNANTAFNGIALQHNLSQLCSLRTANTQRRNRAVQPLKAVAVPEQKKAEQKQNEGHSALLQGLGEVGDVPTVHVPWLLRLAHIR